MSNHTSKLLLDEKPLMVMPELACRIGLNEAIVVQQIHYWLKINEAANKNFYDGRFWCYNTFADWQKEFPFWSLITIKRIFANLENRGIVITGNYNRARYDRTKWYSIDYEALEAVHSINLIQCKVPK